MRRWSRLILIALVVALGLPSTALAELQTSADYSMNESEVGAMGDFNGASAGYTFAPSIDDGGATLGEAAVGNSSSAGYQSGGGFNTTAQPGLTLCVGVTGNNCTDFSGSSVNLGTLSILSATTATAKFGVKNYTSYGYAVTIVSTAPTYGSHALTAMGTQSANSTGCSPSCDPGTPGNVEQYGINLTANTSPTTVGAVPFQNPDSTFSFGTAATGYAVANKYRFFDGDTIASAGSSSGETDYTISFLANITPQTPAGAYAGSMSIIATGTY